MCVGFEPVTIVWIHLQRDVIRIPARQHKSGGGECNHESFKDSFPQGTPGVGVRVRVRSKVKGLASVPQSGWIQSRDALNA